MIAIVFMNGCARGTPFLVYNAAIVTTMATMTTAAAMNVTSSLNEPRPCCRRLDGSVATYQPPLALQHTVSNPTSHSLDITFLIVSSHLRMN